jgi:hypothetical protein
MAAGAQPTAGRRRASRVRAAAVGAVGAVGAVASVAAGAALAASGLTATAHAADTPPVGPRSAAWRGYYAHPHESAAERAYCAAAGGRLRFTVLGIAACGPTGDRTIELPSPAGWTVYTSGFQCVEFVDRYLYVRRHWPAPASSRPVDGAQTARWYAGHYRGKGAHLIDNGTRRHAPLPGDVMSMSGTAGFGGVGHAALVTASRVDRRGDGTVTVAGENVSVDGRPPTAVITRLAVRDWRVSAFGFRYVDWMHVG